MADPLSSPQMILPSSSSASSSSICEQQPADSTTVDFNLDSSNFSTLSTVPLPTAAMGLFETECKEIDLHLASNDRYEEGEKDIGRGGELESELLAEEHSPSKRPCFEPVVSVYSTLEVSEKVLLSLYGKGL